MSVFSVPSGLTNARRGQLFPIDLLQRKRASAVACLGDGRAVEAIDEQILLHLDRDTSALS